MAHASKPKPRKAAAARGNTYNARDIGAKAVVAQGENNAVTVTIQEGLSGRDLAEAFDKIYKHIESAIPPKSADKKEIVQTVQNLQAEVTEKGEQADQTRLQRWIGNINQMAPDIVDVIIASLGGPAPAIATVLKKIAARTRQRSPA